MRGGRREVEHRRDARCVRRRGRCWRGVVPRMALRGRRWRSVVRPCGGGAPPTRYRAFAGGVAGEVPRVRGGEVLRGRGSGEVLCGRWRDVAGAIAGCPGVVRAAERRCGRLRERGRLGGGRNVVGRWLGWRGCGEHPRCSTGFREALLLRLRPLMFHVKHLFPYRATLRQEGGFARWGRKKSVTNRQSASLGCRGRSMLGASSD